ncbi:3-dehydroquinate synthase [Lactobacillaceae bacterium Melli_B4]
MKSINVKTKQDQYQIIIKSGSLKQIGSLVSAVWASRKIALILDDNVTPYYLSSVQANLEAHGFTVHPFIIPHGEHSKSLTQLANVADGMANQQFNRSDAVIALGGGVVGDLGGFVAATYMRGIDLIQIPTSFLAQVDSSVGGKTAVDLNHIKNIIGSFHQPDLVVIDPDTLSTLPERDLVEGYGEVVKCAALVGGKFWQLTGRVNAANDLLAYASELIYHSVAFKAQIVMQDEQEAGQRQLLNFGHTIGHGVEALSNDQLRHGEAVSIGMIAISQWFVDQGLSDSNIVDQLNQRLQNVGLPTTTPVLTDKHLIDKIKNDKKNHNGYLNVIYLTKIGQPLIKKVSVAAIEAMLKK